MTEKKFIALLEEVVKKLDETLTPLSGRSLKETTPEEQKKYNDYVRKRIYGE